MREPAAFASSRARVANRVSAADGSGGGTGAGVATGPGVTTGSGAAGNAARSAAAVETGTPGGAVRSRSTATHRIRAVAAAATGRIHRAVKVCHHGRAAVVRRRARHRCQHRLAPGTTGRVLFQSLDRLTRQRPIYPRGERFRVGTLRRRRRARFGLKRPPQETIGRGVVILHRLRHPFLII